MLIKNIRVIDPQSGLDDIRDIHIEDGIIIKICESESNSAAENLIVDGTVEDLIIDGTGLVAAPGLVDVHVHFRDPGFEYKEDIYTGARAAAAGGFTSVVCMANTKPAVDNTETLQYVLDKAAQTEINVYTCADITMGLQGENVTDMKTLLQMGAVGFTDDGIPLKNPEVVEKAMKMAASLDTPLSFHEEDPQFISENGINAGLASEHYGIKGSPRIAEISLIDRDIKIANKLMEEGAAEGNNLCPDIVIQHISSAEGVDLVREARKENPRIHAEACPHHFTLTEEAVIKHGSLAKMNPPLRTEADRQAVIAGLKDGTIEIISTDHAPHSTEEKAKEITKAPSGIIGLETSLGLGIRELVCKGPLSLAELIAKMSTNPAKLYKLNAGRILEGGPADIVIFDPNEEWTVTDNFRSKSCNTPFIGEKLMGRIHMTICHGKVVYNADL